LACVLQRYIYSTVMKKIWIITIAGILLLIGVLSFLFLEKDSAGQPIINNLLPFGDPGSETVDFNAQNNGQNGIADGPQDAFSKVGEGQIRRLSEAPVSGGVSFLKGTTSLVRYVDKATGHIHEVDLKAGIKTRITNTTVPKAQEIVWGKNGDSLVYRFVENGSLRSILGTVVGTTSASSTELRELSQTVLDLNLLNLVSSPKKDQFFGTLPAFEGIEGFLVNQRGVSGSVFWKFPTSEWVANWATDSIITMTTKASADINGFLFFLNQNSKQFSHILTAKGLVVAPSQNTEMILYSESERVQTSLNVYDVKGKTKQSLGVSTLASKCGWRTKTFIVCAVPNQSVNAGAPDNWYQGKISFNDSLWGIEIETGEVKQIAELSAAQEGRFDVINPFVSADGKFLILTNKKDGLLWAVELP
jgi:hypothetical protein